MVVVSELRVQRGLAHGGGHEDKAESGWEGVLPVEGERGGFKGGGSQRSKRASHDPGELRRLTSSFPCDGLALN